MRNINVDYENTTAVYNEMLNYAQKNGYTSFTKLQDKAFRQIDVYNDNNDLFICGETSSGKTLIPLLIYKHKLYSNKPNEQIPNMLFVVPYRALAAQKYYEFCEFFKEDNLIIVQSTGEFQQYDNLIQSGDVDIAIIITEKVYKYSARDDSFLSKYDYMVLDEVGLIDYPTRGIRLDFILAWAKQQREMKGKPRIIALGTPFYNWSAYIQSFNFHLIMDNNRPLQLKDFPVFYNSNFGIDGVTSNNPCLHRVRLMTKKQYDRAKELYGIPAYKCSVRQELCPADMECRHDLSKICPLTMKQCVDPIEYLTDKPTTVYNYILERICRYHIEQNHQILIFLNDREGVKQLCKQLFFQLEDLLKATEDTETFKKELLKESCLEEDDVYGILEEGNEENKDMTYYRALSSGIGFHSRALPYELRVYIEKKLLESCELKIVCSTETLAFGVNSNVDVVIIADLQKNSDTEKRYLTLNEYRNYAGRAGRLSQGRLKEFNACGYVYTLICNNQCSFWEQFNLEKEKSTPLFSKLFDGNAQNMAFILLNLFPYNNTLVALKNVNKLIQILPHSKDFNISFWTKEIHQALKFLENERLIACYKSHHSVVADEDNSVKYGLTKRGRALRGFLITNPDYVLIRNTIKRCNGGIFGDIDYESLLYYLLTSQHVESELNGIFYNSTTRMTWDEIINFYNKRFEGKNLPEWFNDAQPNNRTIYILAALLNWMAGDSNKLLYNKFGVHYAMINKIAEQLAYLLEIAWAMLPAVLDEIWSVKNQNLEKFGIEVADFYEVLKNKNCQMHKFFYTVFFGINIDVWNEMLIFLCEQSDEESKKMLDKFSEDHIEPESAHILRRIAVRYRFFKQPSLANDKNIELRNNYNNQKWQYYNDIRDMGVPIIHFFEQSFNMHIANNVEE